MNNDITRWLRVSIDKHFTDLVNLPVFVEGWKRDTRKLKDFYELRVDGPRINQPSKGYYIFYMEVNTLVQSAMDDEDYLRIEADISAVLNGFTDVIKVFKYGDGPNDTGEFIGCLRIQDAYGRERLLISRLGQLDPATELIQAIVEGHYQINLKEGEF